MNRLSKAKQLARNIQTVIQYLQDCITREEENLDQLPQYQVIMEQVALADAVALLQNHYDHIQWCANLNERILRQEEDM